MYGREIRFLRICILNSTSIRIFNEPLLDYYFVLIEFSRKQRINFFVFSSIEKNGECSQKLVTITI